MVAACGMVTPRFSPSSLARREAIDRQNERDGGFVRDRVPAITSIGLGAIAVNVAEGGDGASQNLSSKKIVPSAVAMNYPPPIHGLSGSRLLRSASSAGGSSRPSGGRVRSCCFAGFFLASRSAGLSC